MERMALDSELCERVAKVIRENCLDATSDTLALAVLAALGFDSPYFVGIAFDNPESAAEVVINGEPYVPLSALRSWQERALKAEGTQS